MHFNSALQAKSFAFSPDFCSFYPHTNAKLIKMYAPYPVGLENNGRAIFGRDHGNHSNQDSQHNSHT